MWVPPRGCCSARTSSRRVTLFGVLWLGGALRAHSANSYSGEASSRQVTLFGVLWLGGALRAHSADSYSGEVCYVVILGGSVSAHMLGRRFGVTGSRAWLRFPDVVPRAGP